MISAFIAIEAERRRVLRKFGVQDLDDGRWALVLAEEVGEAAKDALEGNEAGLVAELVQVAAVATLWVEAIGRRCSQP